MEKIPAFLYREENTGEIPGRSGIVYERLIYSFRGPGLRYRKEVINMFNIIKVIALVIAGIVIGVFYMKNENKIKASAKAIKGIWSK